MVDVEVMETIPHRVATIRVTTDPQSLSAEVETKLTEVWAYLDEHGQIPAGPPLSICHHLTPDGDIPAPGDWTVDVGFPIEGDLPVSAGIQVQELPGGVAASVLHQGDYSGLVNAYLLLQSWLLANDRQSAGVPWEIYLTDPGQEPDPDLWQTQVVWPIAP